MWCSGRRELREQDFFLLQLCRPESQRQAAYRSDVRTPDHLHGNSPRRHLSMLCGRSEESAGSQWPKDDEELSVTCRSPHGGAPAGCPQLLGHWRYELRGKLQLFGQRSQGHRRGLERGEAVCELSKYSRVSRRWARFIAQRRTWPSATGTCSRRAW